MQTLGDPTCSPTDTRSKITELIAEEKFAPRQKPDGKARVGRRPYTSYKNLESDIIIYTLTHHKLIYEPWGKL